MRFSTSHTLHKKRYSLVGVEPISKDQIKVLDLDTSTIKIGDEYKVGEVVFRVIGNDLSLNEKVNSGEIPVNNGGVVVEVLSEGDVDLSDFAMINRNCGSLFVGDIQSLFVDATPNRMVAKMCLKEDLLINEVKESVKSRYNLK